MISFQTPPPQQVCVVVFLPASASIDFGASRVQEAATHQRGGVATRRLGKEFCEPTWQGRIVNNCYVINLIPE